MATQVVMAQLSPTMEEGKLIEWKVEEGDSISQGDIIAEIETDKATVDMEATASGTLVEQTLAPGEEVAVGTVIGYLESDG